MEKTFSVFGRQLVSPDNIFVRLLLLLNSSDEVLLKLV
jgi:hypothetical protein